MNELLATAIKRAYNIDLALTAEQIIDKCVQYKLCPICGDMLTSNELNTTCRINGRIDHCDRCRSSYSTFKNKNKIYSTKKDLYAAMWCVPSNGLIKLKIILDKIKLADEDMILLIDHEIDRVIRQQEVCIQKYNELEIEAKLLRELLGAKING